jgi:hypothetical protein
VSAFYAALVISQVFFVGAVVSGRDLLWVGALLWIIAGAVALAYNGRR